MRCGGWDEVRASSQQQHRTRARSKNRVPKTDQVSNQYVQLYILSIKIAPFRNTKMDDMMLARQLAEKYWQGRGRQSTTGAQVCLAPPMGIHYV